MRCWWLLDLFCFVAPCFCAIWYLAEYLVYVGIGFFLFILYTTPYEFVLSSAGWKAARGKTSCWWLLQKLIELGEAPAAVTGTPSADPLRRQSDRLYYYHSTILFTCPSMTKRRRLLLRCTLHTSQSIICVSWFVPLFPLQSCLVITRATFGRWHSLLLVTTSTHESRGNGLEIMSASETDMRYFLHRCPSPSFSFTVIDKMIESGDSGAVTAGRFQTNFYHAQNSPQRRLL